MTAATDKHDLSFSVLWSPLPIITWIIPVIGHLGIANSQGIASDFRGPYYVGDDGHMAFGAPTRFLKIDIGGISGGADRWDEAIVEANQVYSGRNHNLFCDNCHSHVAYALNHMPVKSHGIDHWDMVKLALLVFVKGEFLSWRSVALQFGPFLILVFTICVFL